MLQRVVGGIVVVAFWFAAVPIWAVTKDWNDGSDNWSNGAAWTPAGVPGAGDNAHVVFGDGVARTVTYDYAGPAITLGNVSVDLTGPGVDASTLTMPAGELTTSFGQSIGTSGRGTFNQTGGKNSLNTLALRLGDFAGSTGVYNLSGSAVLAANIDEIIGYSGTGSFNQSGGTNSITGPDEHLYLGVNGGTGNYTLTGGSLSAGINENVGYFGTGNFDHSAGTNTVADTLDIGVLASGTGTYTLSGTGQLTANQLTVGHSGIGTFTQSGGTNTTSSLTVGAASTGLGSYTFNVGLLTVTGAEIIGSQATGSGLQAGGAFAQNGGTHRVSALAIATGIGSTGAFNLGSGTFVSTVSESIGEQGTGIFTQFGGSHSANNISIGGIAGASGTYSLIGGTASAANIYVGGGSATSGGTGVMSVSGANTVLTVPGTVTVYNTPGTGFSLLAGTMNVGAINTGGITSLFNWSGGTLNITNDVTWDPGAAASSTSTIFGSSLSLTSFKTLKVTGNETIGGNGAFTLNVGSSATHAVTGNITVKTGSTLSSTNTSILTYSSLTQAGGTISGSLRNVGNFTHQSGTLSAFFINDGTVSFGASLNMSGGLQNETAMTVGSGQTLTIGGNGTNNLGSFTLNGGTIGSGPSFLNSAGGTLTAHGVITPTVTNHGTLIVDGVLSVASSSTNDGIIQGAGTLTGFSTLGNSAGGVINSTNPGGTLILTNLSNNNLGGVMNVGPTSTLSISGSLTNAGIVNLQGAGARLSGGTVTNNGLIQGFGTIAATLATSNSGVFRASGGELDFTGSFMNSSQSQVQILAGSTAMFLQGMLSNSGTISLTGGTLDNNNRTMQNLGTINGYGTIRTGGLTNTPTKLISVGEGNMDVLGSVVNSGVISIQSGRSVYFFGNVSGSGSFTGTGTAVFLASLSPGNSPALVTFAGGATLGGGTSLSMELGGSTVGSGYDKIDVEGQLSIGGGLSVTRINGFMPAPWSTFDLLDWGTLSGTFSSISLPTLALGQWDTSQLYVNGTLSVALAGDFNHDAMVDDADYVVWRKGLGTIYVAGDYDLWRAHYGDGVSGSGSGSTIDGAAVPEPGAVALALTIVVAGGLRRGKRHAI